MRVEVADELQRGHDRELVARAILVEDAEVVQLDIGADADQVFQGWHLRRRPSFASRRRGSRRRGCRGRARAAYVAGVVGDAQKRREDAPVDRAAFVDPVLDLFPFLLTQITALSGDDRAQAGEVVGGDGEVVPHHVELR